MDSESPTALAVFQAKSRRAEIYLSLGCGAVLLVGLLVMALAESGSMLEQAMQALAVAGMSGGIWLVSLPAFARIPPRPIVVEAAFVGFYVLVLSGAGAVCYLDTSIVEALEKLPFLIVPPQTAVVCVTTGACSLAVACLVWIRRRVRALSTESEAPQAVPEGSAG